MNTLRKKIVDPVDLVSRSNRQDRLKKKRPKRKRKLSKRKNIKPKFGL